MANNMSYQQARRLRGQSLSSVYADELIQGKGYLSGIKSAIGSKTRARITGIKERFDPLNIAKFLTGGSRLGPAILGKMLGRSRKDIEYFAGRARPVGSQTATKIGKDPSASGDMSGMSDILNKILELQQRTYDNIREQRERLNNFKEEKDLEADKRHKDLLNAIKGFSPGKKQTAEKINEESPSFSLADLLGGATLASKLLDVLKWFGGPVGMALLGVTGIVGLIMLLAAGLKKLADNTPNMKALSPNEAQAILQNGSEKDIEKAGGREFLEETIKNGRKNAMDTMNMSENTDEEKEIKRQKILELGGEDKLKKIIADEKTYEIPAAGSGQSMADKLPFTKQQFIGTGLAAKSKEGKWNKEYAPYYNDDGTKKTATPTGSTASPATPATTSPASSTASPAAATASTAAAMTTTPPSQQLNAVTAENRSAKMDSMVNSSSAVTNNVVANNTPKPKSPKPSIPPVRNMEATLQRMIYNSTRVV